MLDLAVDSGFVLRLCLLLQVLIRRYNLAADTVLFELVLYVLDATRVRQDGVEFEAVAAYASVPVSLVKVLLCHTRESRTQL
jgi:uncharacterized protein YebE (UPF0316 family)